MMLLDEYGEINEERMVLTCLVTITCRSDMDVNNF